MQTKINNLREKITHDEQKNKMTLQQIAQIKKEYELKVKDFKKMQEDNRKQLLKLDEDIYREQHEKDILTVEKKELNQKL